MDLDSLALPTLSLFLEGEKGEKGLAHCHRAICSGIHLEARGNCAMNFNKIPCGSRFYSRLMLFCESAIHSQWLDLQRRE